MSFNIAFILIVQKFNEACCGLLLLFVVICQLGSHQRSGKPQELPGFVLILEALAVFAILFFLSFEQNIAFPDEPHGPKHDQKEHNKSLDSEEGDLPGKGLLALLSMGLGSYLSSTINYNHS